jgi:hypothetical protein
VSRSPRARSRGIALVWALFCTLVIAGIVVSGTDSFLAVERMGATDFAADGQARAVAEAGLVDAFAWFRRQQTQPVTTFAPQRNMLANPVVNETDDPVPGLVRDYEIMPSLWGRYEILKPVAAEAFTDSNGNGLYDYGEAFTDTNGNGRRDPATNTRDVSIERGQAGAGSIWRIESRGTVYRRPDLTLALGQGPNVRVSSITVAAEIRRLVIVAPATAAVCTRNGSGINIGTRTRIAGGLKGGLIYLTGTGTPVISSTAELTGSPNKGTTASYVDSVDSVFGVNITQLKGMADGSYSDPAAFPDPIGDFTLNVVQGPITFDATRSLKGTGVVVVTGNCTINANSDAFFNGVLYVQGNLVVRGPVFIRGTVIVTGTVDIAGSGGDYSEINYDAGLISQVMTLLGQYRFSTAPYVPSPMLPDGTPDEGGLIRLQKSGATLPGGNLPTALGDSLPPPN